MRPFAYLIIPLCLLLSSPVHSIEGPTSFAKGWDLMPDYQRHLYLIGLRDGMELGGLEFFDLVISHLEQSENLDERKQHFVQSSISTNFPEIEAVQKAMTKLYLQR
jgi:hypothetical protein